jgi:hypothetical protein
MSEYVLPSARGNERELVGPDAHDLSISFMQFLNPRIQVTGERVIGVRKIRNRWQ